MKPCNFYLSSHDLGADFKPRVCHEVREAVGVRNGAQYLVVNVEPPVEVKFFGGASTGFHQIILAIAGGRSLRDIGRVPVMVDIVVSPTYSSGSVDERACSRIGTGSLHASYADAIASAPLEDTDG